MQARLMQAPRFMNANKVCMLPKNNSGFSGFILKNRKAN
jgi:hypothetical protein